MSWFARSIANTFNLDDEDTQQPSSTPPKPDPETNTPQSPKQGVKEDLSEITKTLTTKIWGVASFLAPPPSDQHQHQDHQPGQSDPEDVDPGRVVGIRRDFAEIGGRFRSGIWKLKDNVSNIINNVSLDDGEVVGVTDEVLGFVREVAMCPETWMDFPLEEEDDGEDFELSDVQQEHALAVESLVPRLASLRIELCPGYMSESSFWKIYFVLLHPRLEPQAAELLSTPEIVKARASLTHELKPRSNTQTQEKDSSLPSDTPSEAVPLEVYKTPLTASAVSVKTEKTEIHPVPTEEIEIVDKAVIQEEPRKETRPEDQVVSSKTITNVVEDKDEDDWLKEDSSENVNVNVAGTATIPIENDEDVSFSDLEEDDDEDAATTYKK